MVIRRKKGFTAKQSKRTSRKMSDSTYGTHVDRGSHARGRMQNASSVSFSNSRAAYRASRGVVDTITPNTSSGESQAAYRQRTRQTRYIEDVQRKAKRRRVLTFVIAALVIIGLAVGAGYIAFRGTVVSKMSLGDSDAKTALVASKEGEVSYTLISVELGAVAKPLARSGPDVLLLVRLDEDARTMAIINVPADLRITLNDSEYHHLCEAAQNGDAALIDAVSRYTGVNVSHFVKLSQSGFVDLVEALDGVDVEVDQVIDDPHAGDVYFIPAGRVHALGKGLLVAEIQQTSDCTYRIYDYDRLDKDGRKRQLHTAEAMDAIDFSGVKGHANTNYNARTNESTTIAACPYFITRLIPLDAPIRKNLEDQDTFVIYMCVDGIAAVKSMGTIVPMHAGECVLVPAVADQVELFCEGPAKLLEVTIDTTGWNDAPKEDGDWMAQFVG